MPRPSSKETADSLTSTSSIVKSIKLWFSLSSGFGLYTVTLRKYKYRRRLENVLFEADCSFFEDRSTFGMFISYLKAGRLGKVVADHLSDAAILVELVDKPKYDRDKCSGTNKNP